MFICHKPTLESFGKASVLNFFNPVKEIKYKKKNNQINHTGLEKSSNLLEGETHAQKRCNKLRLRHQCEEKSTTKQKTQNNRSSEEDNLNLAFVSTIIHNTQPKKSRLWYKKMSMFIEHLIKNCILQ